MGGHGGGSCDAKIIGLCGNHDGIEKDTCQVVSNAFEYR